MQSAQYPTAIEEYERTATKCPWTVMGGMKTVVGAQRYDKGYESESPWRNVV